MLCALMLASAQAAAQTAPSNFPLATLPLNGQDAVLLDQGSGCATHTLPCATKQAPSIRVGQPLAQPTPPTSPFVFQVWWDTSVNPVQYKVYNGSVWVPVYQADTVTGIPSFPGNVYLPTGNLAIGSAATVPNWPITLFENNTVSGGTGITSNTYENGTGAVGGIYRAFATRGSQLAPTAVQANDVLGAFQASGYWSGKVNPYFIAGDKRAAIELQAAENYSAVTNNGTQIVFKDTPLASTTMAEVARFDSNGLLGIGTTAPNFGVTLSKNNPIPAGGTVQGYAVNTYENGTSLTGAAFRSFTARGTASAPTAVVTNDLLLSITASGFWTGRSSGFATASDNRAGIQMSAAENWSGSSNNGTYMTFGTTSTGAGTQTERLRLQASGGLSLGTTTDPGIGNLLLSGNLQTPSVALSCTVFASRPGSPSVGATACFTDSTVNTFGTTIAGSGANKVKGWFNGTNWTVTGI